MAGFAFRVMVKWTSHFLESVIVIYLTNKEDQVVYYTGCDKTRGKCIKQAYQSTGVMLCSSRPKGFRLFRLRRLEKCHKIVKSSEVRPIGLQNPLLSQQIF